MENKKYKISVTMTGDENTISQIVPKLQKTVNLVDAKTFLKLLTLLEKNPQYAKMATTLV